MSSDNASSQHPSVDSETVEQTKRQIRSLVSEIAQISKSDLGPQEYYAAFLQRIVSALAAVGGAVWVFAEEKRLQVAYQIKLSDTLLDPESEDAIRHLRLLNHVIRSKQSQLIPPLSGASDESSGGNPTRYLLVLAPLEADGQIEGLVEVFQRPDSQPATQRGYLRFLQQMCELASEWLKSRKLRHFSDRHSLWADADHFSRMVHDSLDARETAYTVVNEGRRLIGCDRVSVAILRGRKCRVEAISGQDTLENRSNIVTALGRLATKVVATGEPLWYAGSTEDLPPQIEESLQEYLDESHGKSLAVLPLRKPAPFGGPAASSVTGEPVGGEGGGQREVIGALIVEEIESNLPPGVLAPRVDLVYEHSTRALANALEHEGVFLMPLWRSIGRAKWLVQARTLPKTLAVSAVLLAAVLALIFVPTDFEIPANGSLQPAVKQDIFADVEGKVVEVRVGHREMVNAGDVVAVLRNPNLEVELENVSGDLLSTSEKLASVQRELLHQELLTDVQRGQLSGEKAQLKQRQESLRKQVDLLKEKRARLQVISPKSGRVITWDVKNLLAHRSVTPGQVLMTVADTNGEWELELYMPGRRMGHVERAQRELKEQLDVTYILATDPGSYRHGVVKDVDPATHLHKEEGHSVRIRVRLDEQEVSQLGERRPGASVKARLHCGRRSIGYAWLHEALEWLQVHVLFRLF